MLTAAVNIVDIHGKTTAGDLLPVFEEFLDNAPKERKYDDARQSVVILMGSLAKHLDPNDPKVRPIMRQLILALNTPSQQVQEAVANCLPPLVISRKRLFFEFAISRKIYVFFFRFQQSRMKHQKL